MKAKDSKNFISEVSETLGENIAQLFDSKVRVEVNITETAELFIFDGKPLLARSDGQLFPTLTFNELLSRLPKMVVDMGAVPYVCKGADVMAPGVRSIQGEFNENDLVLVVDERHGKPLSVGAALFSSEAMKTVNHGKAVRNLHYVGDKLWNHIKT